MNEIMYFQLTETAGYTGNYTDAGRWNLPQHCKTLTIECQGQVYVIGRSSASLTIAKYNPAANSWQQMNNFAQLTDNEGWNVPQCYTTLRCVLWGGGIYLIGRGSSALHLLSLKPTWNSWNWVNLGILAGFSDSEGYNQPKCYETFRAVVLDDTLWMFIRGPTGFAFASYNLQQSRWSMHQTLSWLTDAQGFASPQYYATIQVSAVNHQLLITARAPDGINLGIYYPQENRIELVASLPLFSDVEGGDIPQCYRTICYTAVDTKLYVCGYRNGELSLAYFDTVTKRWNILPSKPGFLNSCVTAQYCYESLRFLSVGSKLLVFCRCVSNMLYAVYDLTSNTWSQSIINPLLGEIAYNQYSYYGSLTPVVIGKDVYIAMRVTTGIRMIKAELFAPTP